MIYILTFLLMLSPSCSWSKSYSQYEQDLFLYCYFLQYAHGNTFVDIGAHDGITYSNTYMLEKEYGWTGICIEPLGHRFEQLQTNRNCICVQGCIADQRGTKQFMQITSPKIDVEMTSGLIEKYNPLHRDKIQSWLDEWGGTKQFLEVNCFLLNDVLHAHAITHVNFLSIDTEGGEFDILTSIDFSRYIIDVILVEDNYGDPRIPLLLEQQGYIFIKNIEQDLIFVHKQFLTYIHTSGIKR